ncbi:uncharacterized protein SPPG_08890 [Spizellomyces punctatus DAOM BR117]|uniref:Uncharacterized protein n=1 Tax=Spizellomyces punctatus (strain DAOM BR117) TaxID=645134 RepID=A0A0L0HQR1_SPIPD|nr:uncharacterized protein SPPG_08890 [Spizellomyces punctatus DAOM BR117]KND03437.1 hypothetical protein SPPG_08890 [Spizellomyces punctatus DAOM BR117]|eukprot:XP_016611476.1 hypothetical protein SPPG_08890 [Spizellomyces punctatus DAOM BR117]
MSSSTVTTSNSSAIAIFTTLNVAFLCEPYTIDNSSMMQCLLFLISSIVLSARAAVGQNASTNASTALLPAVTLPLNRECVAFTFCAPNRTSTETTTATATATSTTTKFSTFIFTQLITSTRSATCSAPTTVVSTCTHNMTATTTTTTTTTPTSSEPVGILIVDTVPSSSKTTKSDAPCQTSNATASVVVV